MAKSSEARQLDEGMARVEARARDKVRTLAADIVQLLGQAQRGNLAPDCVDAALIKAQEIVELAR